MIDALVDCVGDAGAMRRPRVLILQRVLPHYRVPFFQELSRSPRFDYVVAHGEQSDAAALVTVDRPPGVETIRIANRYLTCRGREIAVFQRGVAALLTAGDYDAVVAEFNIRILSNVVGCVRGRVRGRVRRGTHRSRFVWWGHGFGPASTPVVARVRRVLADVADAVLLYDSAQAARFQSLGVTHDKIFVAPNSIDTALVERFARPDARPRENLLYAGRLTATKKLDLLLRAFALVRDTCSIVRRLVIIGDGPERARLEALARQLAPPESVHFTGTVTEEAALAEWFNTAFVSVSPGPIGLAAIHSLAYGVPVLVARDEAHGPEATALRHEHNSLSFSRDDPQALAACIAGIDATPERRDRMARNARDTGARFGLAGMVAAFDNAVTFALAAA